MERLTKMYEDSTHAAADDLPCGENSWEYKRLLIEKLGAYEDTGLELEEIKELKARGEVQKMYKPNPNIYCCPECGEKIVPMWDYCPWCGQHVTDNQS